MRLPSIPLALGLFTTLVLAACSSDDSSTPNGTAGTAGVAGSGAGGQGGTAGTSQAGNGGSAGTGGSGTATCPDSLVEAPNSEWCAGDSVPIDCSLDSAVDDNQVCGVAVAPPSEELSRSSNVTEFAGSGPPNLSCLLAANYPNAGTSAPVTMSGLAKIFSHGCASTDLRIEVYTVKRTGGPDDGDLDTKVGSVVTPLDCTPVDVGVAVPEADCVTRYLCKYSIDMLPSETELVVLTVGDLWAPFYEYNVFIPTAQVLNGVYSHDVRALAVDDYTVISQMALGAPNPVGNGFILGEVHDCGDVRLSGATVDVSVKRANQIYYFNDDESHPLVDPAAGSTSSLGLYAAFDVERGPVAVGALGLVGGDATTVGFYKARVFPDSVTAVTFQGLHPYQIHP